MLSTSSQARAPGLPPRRFRTTIDVTLGKSSPSRTLRSASLPTVRPSASTTDRPRSSEK